MKYHNPKIREGINVTDVHPLAEFIRLLAGLFVIIGTVVVVFMSVAHHIVSWVPFSFERNLAERFTPEFTHTSSTYLQSLAERLASEMNLPESMEITVNYSNSDIVNAMATLGGNIIVFRGLIEKTPSENVLAMVLAHEIAHIKHRHPIQALGRGLSMVIALTALLGAQGGDAAEMIINYSGGIANLAFSRTQEEQADQDALAALIKVYGHANGATAIFDIIEAEQDGSDPPEFLSTHPHPQKRVHAIQQMLRENGWSNIGSAVPLPEDITALQANFTNTDVRVSECP